MKLAAYLPLPPGERVGERVRARGNGPLPNPLPGGERGLAEKSP